MLFKKFPIFVQLISMLFITMIIPTTLLIFYSTNSLMKYSEEEIAESVTAQLKSNINVNETEIFNIIQDIIMLVESDDIKALKDIHSYEELNSDYEHIEVGLDLLARMKSLQENNRMVESVIFIPDQCDYLISSRQSIMRKKHYGDLKWFNTACEQMKGVSGYFYGRKEEDTPIISYMYRLNRLTTSLKGVLVVNIYEEKVKDNINYGSKSIDSQGFLMEKDGTILVHQNRNLLFQNAKLPTYIQEVIAQGKNEGNFSFESENKRMLCVYAYSNNRNWIYGLVYPMEDMLEGVNDIRLKQFILTVAIILCSIILSVIYALHFSRPMKQLMKKMREKNILVTSGIREGNEINYLIEAFESIELQEANLYNIIKEKEKDTTNRILHNLLNGEVDLDKDIEEIKKIFPYRIFMVVITGVDSRKQYLEQSNSKIRNYQRYLLMNEIETIFPKEYVVHSARYEGGVVATVINMEAYDQTQTLEMMGKLLGFVSQKATKIFKYTVSIGVSGVHTGCEHIQACAYEAKEALSRKILTGNQSIIFWENRLKMPDKTTYYYPYEQAEKITNYLNVGNLKGIEEELTRIEQEIRKRDYSIDYENIKMVFGQLGGNLIKFIVERQISMSKLLERQNDIYSSMAAAETLEELKTLLYQYYEKVIDLMSESEISSEADQEYSKRILDYIHNHYKEELLYEEVAEEIGISYSYLRKLIKKETGKSLNDYINKLRIEEAKVLLRDTNQSLVAIANEVGYHNLQSITRYFKKFEGISPKEFRMLYTKK